MILDSLADGLSPAEIQAAYPQLNPEDIEATLAYVAYLAHQEILAPLPL